MTKNQISIYPESPSSDQHTTSTQANIIPSDAPPPYTPPESHQSFADNTASSSAITTSNPPLPPPNAQRTQAPLRIASKNRSIKGAFQIVSYNGTDNKSQPDVYFHTTNGSIATNVWFQSVIARPVSVEASTTNSSIDISVLPPFSQCIALSATSTNGSIRAALPTSFHGLLTVSTTNSRHTLSPALQARSIRVPYDDAPEDTKVVAYEIGGPHGTSTAVLKTTNSKIEVGLVGDVLTAKDEGGCLVC